MRIIYNPEEMLSSSTLFKESQKSIGLVPTLGYLHEGHASLIKRSVKENNITVLSVFCNPTQFNDPEDYNSYPSDLAADVMLAESAGATIVFAPNLLAMYPEKYRFKIESTDPLLNFFEGVERPGHFCGVMTVVMKLANIVSPTRLYLGEKDRQQVICISEMFRAFFINVEVIPCKTTRSPGGAPLSSRSVRLSESGLKKADEFSQILKMAKTDEEAILKMNQKGFSIEYVGSRDGVRYGAVNIEGTRIIDNIDIFQKEDVFTDDSY